MTTAHGATGIVGAAGAAVVALLVLRSAVAVDAAERNWEFLPDMVRSPAVESQSVCDELPGGLAHQAVVSGVVVRGHESFRYGATPEEAKRAGEELSNPFLPDAPDALARGAEVYRVNCLPCHGVKGEGDGPVVQRGMAQPPSFAAARPMSMRDGEMFHVLTKGQGNMASYAAQVSPEDRWKVILHVRALQQRGQGQ